MSQIETARYVELISAIAVVVSLVFVGFELRQSNHLAESEAVFNLNSSFNELNLLMAENADLTAIFIGAFDGDIELTRVDSFRLEFFSTGWFNVWDAAWIAHQRGIIDYQSFDSYMKSACYMIPRFPFMLAAWHDNKGTFTRGFVEYIESNCAISK